LPGYSIPSIRLGIEYARAAALLCLWRNTRGILGVRILKQADAIKLT